MKFELSPPIFKKSTNIKIHENPSSGSQVVSHRCTDMVKLIVTVCNFANRPDSSIRKQK
jgi:hypothetical protein